MTDYVWRTNANIWSDRSSLSSSSIHRVQHQLAYDMVPHSGRPFHYTECRGLSLQHPPTTTTTMATAESIKASDDFVLLNAHIILCDETERLQLETGKK